MIVILRYLIENNCYTLVTMGGYGKEPNSNNYVFGFNKNGGQLSPINLCADSSKHNISGGLYVYEITNDAGNPEIDTSNKVDGYNVFFFMVEGMDILKPEKVQALLYSRKIKNI